MRFAQFCSRCLPAGAMVQAAPLTKLSQLFAQWLKHDSSYTWLSYFAGLVLLKSKPISVDFHQPTHHSGLFLLSNTMTNHPERIYNWLDSQLSIARFAGSITINGVTYIVAMHEEGQPLVRQDVLAAEAKTKKEGVKK